MKKKLSVMILALTLLLPGTGAFAADGSESADGGVIGHRHFDLRERRAH